MITGIGGILGPVGGLFPVGIPSTIFSEILTNLLFLILPCGASACKSEKTSISDQFVYKELEHRHLDDRRSNFSSRGMDNDNRRSSRTT